MPLREMRVDIEAPSSEQDLSAAIQAAVAENSQQRNLARRIRLSRADQPRVISIEAIGDDVLRISFTGESWIEVNDSESQQIYRDIRVGGRCFGDHRQCALQYPAR